MSNACGGPADTRRMAIPSFKSSCKEVIFYATLPQRFAAAAAISIAKPPKAFTLDAVEDWGARAIGYAELLDVRFPTAHYDREVLPGILTRGSRVEFIEPGDSLLTSSANRAVVPRSVQDLVDRGFHSSVDLRMEGRGDQVPAGTRFNVHRIPIIDNTSPTDAQVMDLFAWIKKPENQPCYLHCEAGVGRTGVMSVCAMLEFGTNPLPTPHRWTLTEAIAESEKCGSMLPNQIAFLHAFAIKHGYPL